MEWALQSVLGVTWWSGSLGRMFRPKTIYIPSQPTSFAAAAAIMASMCERQRSS